MPTTPAPTTWDDLARSPPAWVLVLANLGPLVGVLFLEWDLGLVLLLFWFESAVVGAFNVLKMALVGKWQAFFLVPFFCLHYGIFMAVHLAFIVLVFVDRQWMSFQGPDLPGVLHQVSGAAWAITALVLSHGFSFVYHFLVQGEYRRAAANALFMAPYSRIMIMHVVILLGAVPALATNNAVPALVLLVVLKGAIDLYAHAKEHRKPSPASAPVA